MIEYEQLFEDLSSGNSEDTIQGLDAYEEDIANFFQLFWNSEEADGDELDAMLDELYDIQDILEEKYGLKVGATVTVNMTYPIDHIDVANYSHQTLKKWAAYDGQKGEIVAVDEDGLEDAGLNAYSVKMPDGEVLEFVNIAMILPKK